MISIQNETIKEIPLLHVVKEEYAAQPLPTVFFIHGFTSAKEHNLHVAYLLAEEGFRVLLPDAMLHGKRGQNLNEVVLSTRFWQIVIQTIEELNIIKNEYESRNLIEKGRIGLTGSSMGGIVTLGALTQYEWIKAAASLMGAPAYVGFAKAQINHFKKNGFRLPMTDEEIEEQLKVLADYDLSLHPEKLKQRPLLFWHGKADTVVPYEPAHTFFKTVYPQYENKPDNIRFITDENAGHKVSRKGVLETVKWFSKHL
ncbi:esterase [Jeotgalibacillus proteolyticus]|uniref:Esterase n=1 Tax=Jeotgalibacillus proteolyticus TaxID=2082395 RepID=A0A2S5GH23_9BACL|nr:esterase [Jeotgalibacillus proteolyticus]PPA72350.1 esterase [Jeotgalibacillus proteolyticus]